MAERVLLRLSRLFLLPLVLLLPLLLLQSLFVGIVFCVMIYGVSVFVHFWFLSHAFLPPLLLGPCCRLASLAQLPIRMACARTSASCTSARSPDGAGRASAEVFESVPVSVAVSAEVEFCQP